MIDLPNRVLALRALGALVASGLPPRAALMRWHDEAPAAARRCLVRLSRRLRLGEPTAASVHRLEPELGDDAHALATLVTLHQRTGGHLARLLEALARIVERRDVALREARAAAGGARLSGRLVAGLPLVFLPLSPALRAPLLDPAGAVVLGAGIILAIGGLAWMGRLVPRPPEHDDGAAAVADLVASALRAGSTAGAALSCLAERPPHEVGTDLRRVRRLTRLGLTWPHALQRAADGGLQELGRQLTYAHRFGLPVAGLLERFARSRRRGRHREFELSVRRASVWMMIPLALCVLPSFVLIAIVPYLRGLSFVS